MQHQNINWIFKLKELVSRERKITAAVIAELEKVQRGRLFAEAGYSSLFDFCVRELGYSESAAQRRILAMRLTCDVPEARVSIENGSLSLSTISRVQSFSRQQNIKDPTAKRELLAAVMGKSSRKTEQYLASIAPKPVPEESAKIIIAELTELKFTVDEETMQMLTKIRALWAHKNPSYSQADLIKEMAKFVLSKTDPERKFKSVAAQRGDQTVSKRTADAAVSRIKDANVESNQASTATTHSRYISASVRREVWCRDQGRCQYVNSQTKNRCESNFGIEVDHIHPFAWGGKAEGKNLRLLCKTHNQWQATKLRL